MFEVISYQHNSAAVDGVDFSPSSAISDLVQFIPGVSASLVAFLVWGTTTAFRREIAAIFCCRRKNATVPPVPPLAGRSDYFERLPSDIDINNIHITTELTVLHGGKDGVGAGMMSPELLESNSHLTVVPSHRGVTKTSVS
jgi:hypothetical protein